jgi:hypothetical protein
MISNRNLQNKDALIARLLDSPLAAELERSLNNGAEAARHRAQVALEELTAKHNSRHPKMSAKARELADRRDALSREYEAAKLAALVAKDNAQAEQEDFARRRAEIQALANAGASHLRQRGLDSAEAIERHLGLAKQAG